MKKSSAGCDRCGGAMSFEHFVNATEGGKGWSYDGWRCVYCGEIIDSTILFNRSGLGREKRLSYFRKKVFLVERAANLSKRGLAA